MSAATDDDIRFDESFVLDVRRRTDDYEPIVAILDDLHAVSMSSFFRYMLNWKPYTNAGTVRLRTLVHQIAETCERHMKELTELMLRFGATPRAVGFLSETADTNYTDWKNLLPRLIETQRQQVRAGERALELMHGIHGEDQVRTVIQDQLNEDRENLASLETWARKFA